MNNRIKLTLTSDQLPWELVQRVCDNLLVKEASLTKLDQAIGDGDHGLNISRGCRAILANREELDSDNYSSGIIRIGELLVNNMGGASGALYGTLFMKMGKELSSCESINDIIKSLHVGVNAVMKLGKSQVGDKTLLDVLVPVLEKLNSANWDLAQIIKIAYDASNNTIPVQAKRGRAALLGERSKNHMDPGACSCAIIIVAICEYLIGEQKNE